jgi:1-acyl-sn-glycerol-3-phosphate acyltransferase
MPAANVPYRFPAGFAIPWLITQLAGRSRSLGRDAERVLASISPAPRVEGADHIPQSGPVILVMNHYERPGLRVWWPAFLVSRQVWHTRHQDPPVRWMITDRFYRYHLGPLLVPSAPVLWLLSRVASAYGLVVVPRRGEERGGRARALLRARAALHADGGVIGLTPDPEGDGARALGRAWRNVGASVAALSGGSIPVLPVAVFEDERGALVARFGDPAPFSAPEGSRAERAALAGRLMELLEALLPRGSSPPPLAIVTARV